MATDVVRVQSPPATKYDALIAAQLARAESRIRFLDLTAGLLGFTALTLAYVVTMLLCDSKLLLAQQTRQLSLYVYLAGSAVYLFFTVLRPLRLRVNPYYAARQVEQLLPHAKNSIVNWVDLHAQPLPPAIRGALGQRAAKDLSRVDLDRAISGRRAAWMGGAAGLFALAFVVSFFLLGPAPFLSLLKRTFNPFGVVGVSTRTQLTIVKPEGGNATVTVGRGVNFVVEVGGKVPDPKAADAVKLLYRYEEGDPWLERLLVQEPSREWTSSLSAIEVKNGFWYKITGGDAVTEEYRIGVRAAPAILDFLATYHFRPYVARADEVRRERELKELRGTEILLRVRANRILREGRLEFEGKNGVKTVRGEVDAKDAHTLLARFVLDEDGKYRLFFTSNDSEAYSDPVSYTVTAIADKPPTVELTKPGEDIRLPADALLHVEGKASDDIGVKDLMLRMRVADAKLRGQPYRGGDKLRLTDGGYPRDVEYKDFVELARVQDEKGQAFALKAGMELEYWLEASDACDYLQPNVAESKHYRVLLTEPEKNEAKQKQEKRQADKDKKQHEQKQDQKLQQENQERQQQRQAQEAQNKEEENKSKDGEKGGGEQSQPKEGDPGDKSEGKDNNGQKRENKDGQGENNEPSKEDQKLEEQIKKALEEQQGKENEKGEGKPEKCDQGEGKGAQPDKPEGGDAAGEKSEGENKGAGQQDTKDAGENKDKGQPQSGGDASKGDGKGDNSPSPMPGDKSEPKDGDPKSQPGGGEAGDGKGKADASPQAGEGKSGGAAQASKDAGEGKPQPMGQGAEAAGGDNKPADGQGQQAERAAAGESKDNGDRRGEAKKEGERKDDGKTEAKQGGSSPKGEPSADSEPKPSGDKGAGDAMAKGESKPDGGAKARNATAKDIEDLARSLESKDRQQREEAKRQLEQIEKDAADADARAKAGDALEKMGQPDGAGNGGTPKPGDGSSGEAKKGDGDGSKDDGASGSDGGGKSTGSGKKNGSSGKDGQGSGSGQSPGAQSSQGGSRAGGGGQQRSGNGDGTGQGEGLPSQHKPVKPREHRAAQMQLEDFAKRVNKDILKDAGVSEAAWKKYLESKRKQLTPRETPRPDTPANPQQANALPSMGGRTIQPPASGAGDTHGPDRGQPPPGYRDSFREFTRQMSKKK
jgi:hypothetical protein